MAYYACAWGMLWMVFPLSRNNFITSYINYYYIRSVWILFFAFFFALITRHSLITSETEFVYVTNRSSLWNVMQYKYKIELIRIEVQWPRSKTEIISQRAHCNGIYTNDIIVWTVRVVCICIQNNKNAICMYRVVNYDVFIYIYTLTISITILYVLTETEQD